MALGIGILHQRTYFRRGRCRPRSNLRELCASVRRMDRTDCLRAIPVETVVQWIVELVRELELSEKPASLGLALPGIVRNGRVEDSPNLVQFKGREYAGAGD